MKDSRVIAWISWMLGMASCIVAAAPIYRNELASAFIHETPRIVFAALCAIGLMLILLLCRRSTVKTLIAASPLSGAVIIGWCVFVTTCIFPLANPRLRVFSDEIDLASTAQGLYMVRQPIMLDGYTFEHEGRDLRGPIETSLTIRPTLFPTLVAINHTIRGYSVDNTLLVNQGLYLILVVAISLSIGGRYGLGAALATPLVLLSQPLAVLAATSGCHDVISTFFWVMVTLLVRKVFQSSNQVYPHMLWITLGLWAHTRFESIAYSCVLIASIFAFHREMRSKLLCSPFIGVFPLLVAPVVWQRVLQGSLVELPAGEHLFSLAHFLRNNADLARTFWPLQPEGSPYVWPLQVCGMLTLIIAALCTQVFPHRRAFILIVPTAVFYWVLITSFFWSSPYDPYVNRHYLPLVVFLSWTSICGVATVLRGTRLSLLALPALGGFLFAHETTQTLHLSDLPLGRFGERYEAGVEFAQKYCPDRRCLIIAKHARQFTIHGFSAYDSLPKIEPLLAQRPPIITIDSVRLTPAPPPSPLGTPTIEQIRHYRQEEIASPIIQMRLFP